MTSFQRDLQHHVWAKHVALAAFGGYPEAESQRYAFLGLEPGNECMERTSEMTIGSLFNPETPLKQIAEFADQTFRHCRNLAPDPGWTDFPSLTLHCSMVHMARGIDALLTAGSIFPTQSLLRSMLEARISLAYIHEKEYEQRSLCWMCAYIHQEIGMNELADPTTKRGKEFQEKAKEQIPGWNDSELPNAEQLKKHREWFYQYLKRDSMKPVEEEFQRLKANRKGQPNWYALFSQKRNLRDLACSLNLLAEYEVLFRIWSGVTHNTNAVSLVSFGQDGSAHFRALSDTRGIEKIDRAARIMLYEGTNLIVKKFIKSKSTDGAGD